MKKKYIAPKSEAIYLAPSLMHNDSGIHAHIGERADSEAFSNKNEGWNSSDWSDVSEEE